MSELLKQLHSFSTRVQKRENGTEGWCERYNYFIVTSEHGESCNYAKKCLDLFLADDYEAIKQQFLSLLDTFRKVEGETFGR